jgi:hypothetical protein
MTDLRVWAHRGDAVGDDKRWRRRAGGFLRRRIRPPLTHTEGRVGVDASAYVRAHPQAAVLTVGDRTINVSPETAELATITVPVTRPGPFFIRVTVTAADDTVLLDKNLNIPYPVPPGIRSWFEPPGTANAHVTVAGHGGITIRFPPKR